jgi:putative zinc finger/helix-turn-helix YgiT family protein
MMSDHDCEASVAQRFATEQQPYNFTESGLSNVYLCGIRYFECEVCEQRSAEIPALKELMRVLARVIVRKECVLTGEEIRFLRKRLGKKAIEFAQIIGVRPEEVSRWENDVNPPEKSACKLIRIVYAKLSGDKELDRTINEAFEGWITSIKRCGYTQRINAEYKGKTANSPWKIETKEVPVPA